MARFRINPNVYAPLYQSDNPFAGLARGVNQGMQIGRSFQDAAARKRSLEQEDALLQLDPRDQDYINQAAQVSPEIAQQFIQQKIAQQLKSKQYQPDNEWVTNPDNPDEEIYAQVKVDPQTLNPIVTPIPGVKGGFLTRKRAQAERIQFKKEENQQKQKNIESKMDLDNKKLMQDYSKLKIAEKKLEMDQFEADAKMAEKESAIERDYENDLMKAEDAIDTIDRMIGNSERNIPRHPGFKSSVGRKGGALLFGILDKPIDGTDAANFYALYNKVTGQAFMQAFAGLKGGGQITQVEGEKATQALLEMTVAQKHDAFIDAAKRFQRYTREGLIKAKKSKQKQLEPFKGSSSKIDLRSKYNY